MLQIKVDKRVTEEYEQLRVYSDSFSVSMQNSVHQSNSHFVISLLNIRSFSKHPLDLACDTTLIDSDLVALTETHLYPGQQVAHLSPPCFLQSLKITALHSIA